uniref:Uncharacterized protein n=1 Tax=Branchiostoma floridae TaxID=7739 RepID=C3Y099_BRAFL|eukprot:XP_002610162.1 hypothetical protein BRAFLDRAFT_77080 [Branchiostoma floridae]
MADFLLLAKVLLYTAVVVGGLAVAVTVGLTAGNFHGCCILYAPIVKDTASPTYQWLIKCSSNSNCHFPIGVGVAAVVYGVIYGGYCAYTLISRNRNGLDSSASDAEARCCSADSSNDRHLESGVSTSASLANCTEWPLESFPSESFSVTWSDISARTALGLCTGTAGGLSVGSLLMCAWIAGERTAGMSCSPSTTSCPGCCPSLLLLNRLLGDLMRWVRGEPDLTSFFSSLPALSDRFSVLVLFFLVNKEEWKNTPTVLEAVLKSCVGVCGRSTWPVLVLYGCLLLVGNLE